MAKKKKTVKKKAAVKNVLKKKAAKPVKKTAKKVKRTVRKAVKKTAKTAVKEIVKKAVKKNTQNVVKKSAKSIDYSKAVTPLGNRIVVRLVSEEKTTLGGLIIPDMVKAEHGHLKAEVLAVGSGAKNKKGHVRPLDVQKGDVVLFSEFSGTKVVFNSEELHIVQETDVLGILQK